MSGAAPFPKVCASAHRQFWNRSSLVEISERLGQEFVQAEPFKESAARITAQIREQAAGLKSFQRVYQDEIVGVLDLFAETLMGVLIRARPDGTGPPPDRGTPEYEKLRRECLSFLVAAASTPNGKVSLRSVHIKTSLHAALRWNKQQAMKANDFFDFAHACAAVGYCRAFFTEGPLASVLNRSDLRLAQDFSCLVSADIGECLAFVESIDGPAD